MILITVLATLLVTKPSFAQWEDPPPSKPAPEKVRFPYKSGAPVPRGYHVESRVRPGLLVTGILMTGVAYAWGALTLGSSKCSGDHWMLLPFAGPFMAADRADGNASSGPCDDPEGIRGAIRTESGLGQTVGGILLLFSASYPRQDLVPDDTSAHADAQRRWTVVPALGPSSAGFSMIGRI